MDAYIHIYIHIHTYINTVHIIHLGHHGIRTMLLLTVDVKLSPSNVALNHKNILTHTYTHTHTPFFICILDQRVKPGSVARKTNSFKHIARHVTLAYFDGFRFR